MNFLNQKTRGLVLASSFWMLESFIHRFLQGETQFELIPSDSNELWMRVVICALIILFGIQADNTISKLLAKDKEKQSTFEATIAAANHILNNFTYKMTYFRMKMEESGEFDAETPAALRRYD